MDKQLERVTYDPKEKRWLIKSANKKVALYYVQWSDILKRYTCTCPNWRYRCMGNNTDCKHIHCITEVLQFGSKEELEQIGIKR